MRYLLMCSALVLIALIALRFIEPPRHHLPFEDRRVVILSGGRIGEPFQEAVKIGAQLAEQDFGCEVDIVCTNWDPISDAARFQEEMAGVPDGICVIGDPANVGLMTLIESAVDEGITITSYQRPMPEAQSRYAALGYGFVGPDFYKVGQDLINAAVEKHHLAQGALVLLVQDPTRRDEDGLFGGTMAAITAHGLTAEMVNFDMRRPESISESLGERLASGTRPALVCSLQAQLESCMYTMKTEGLDPGDVPLVGIGIGSGMVTLLKTGRTSLSLLVDQNIPLQAYLSVLQACMGKKYAAVGPRLHTPYAILSHDDKSDQSGVQTTHFVERY